MKRGLAAFSLLCYILKEPREDQFSGVEYRECGCLDYLPDTGHQMPCDCDDDKYSAEEFANLDVSNE